MKIISRNNSIILIKGLVMLAAYGFLAYKLAHYEYWQELLAVFRTIDFKRFLFIAAVVALMPVNWMLETTKWQMLAANITNLRFYDALKAVLAGLSSGYITPNRIGEFAGRIIFLPREHRLAGIALSIVNSLTQNIIVTVFGLAGASIYFSALNNTESFPVYFAVIGIFFLGGIAFYIALPSILRMASGSKRLSEKHRNAVKAIGAFNTKQLIAILGVSSIRYAVFCTQYYAMLLFFDINITPLQAMAAIPASYLLVAFTPSFAAAEPAIRSGVAIIIFSAFSTNEIGVMLTGILIWMINFVVPMLAGTVIIGKTKIHKKTTP